MLRVYILVYIYRLTIYLVGNLELFLASVYLAVVEPLPAHKLRELDLVVKTQQQFPLMLCGEQKKCDNVIMFHYIK